MAHSSTPVPVGSSLRRTDVEVRRPAGSLSFHLPTIESGSMI